MKKYPFQHSKPKFTKNQRVRNNTEVNFTQIILLQKVDLIRERWSKFHSAESLLSIVVFFPWSNCGYFCLTCYDEEIWYYFNKVGSFRYELMVACSKNCSWCGVDGKGLHTILTFCGLFQKTPVTRFHYLMPSALEGNPKNISAMIVNDQCDKATPAKTMKWEWWGRKKGGR